MKILVTVKRVMDYKTPIRLKSDKSGIETSHAKMIMNPFDEIAMEEALRIKEKGVAQEIIAVSIGDESCQETLRTALALGADRAILLKTTIDIQPLAAAHLIKALSHQEKPDLILLGKQSVDTDNNQMGQMLAGLLNWPQGTFASKLIFHDQGVSVTREIDGGLEKLFLSLPCVITTDLRLNEPRYLSLPQIVQAKRKPITIQPAEDYYAELSPRLKTLEVTLPKKPRARIKVKDATELVKYLKEAQVL